MQHAHPEHGSPRHLPIVSFGRTSQRFALPTAAPTTLQRCGLICLSALLSAGTLFLVLWLFRHNAG